MALTTFAAATVVFLASIGPTVVPLDENRFEVRIVFDDHSPRGHAEAQIALIRAATRHCRGRGSAVSEGQLTLNRAEPIRGGREALELIEAYTCVPDSRPR